MYNEFGGTLSNLALAKHRKSRAINAENPRGEKGKGGMAGQPVILDHPEREARVLMTSQVVRQ